MAEYKKHILGEATKGVTAAIVGALLMFAGQKSLNSDLEYKQTSRDAYLSAPLGQQGLTMAYGGKPIKNVSVVEFTIYNRTSKQIGNADLLFKINDGATTALVSGGIFPPKGMSTAETVEELPSKDEKAKKFRIKVMPKQRDSEYFHAVFVFDGDKAPSMSVSSTTGEVAIGPYRQWKDNIATIAIIVGFMLLAASVQLLFTSLVEYFTEPKKHKKQVERFAEHAGELQREEKLKSYNEDTLTDARTIYASFTRPKPSKFWSKVLPDQRFEY